MNEPAPAPEIGGPRLASGLGALAVALALLAACDPEPLPRFPAPVRLGGRVISAETLERGARVYRHHCRTCHGEHGDGKGPSGRSQRPPPRDFGLGVYKFASVPAGALPRDEDLERTVRAGLRGTAMLAWDVPSGDLHAVVQYLKTFSPRWRDEEPPAPVRSEPDPWTAGPAAAAERGRRVYHGVARCAACHPAYAPRDEVARLAADAGVEPVTRADLDRPLPENSDFGERIVPPDFARSELRSIRRGHRLDDLHRVIAAGIGGTAMPTWQGALPDADIWALAHYVDWLRREQAVGTRP